MKIVHINTTDNRGGAAQIALQLHTELNRQQNMQSRMLVREKNTDDVLIDTFGARGWRKWLSVLTARDHTFIGGKEMLNHPWIKEADVIHLHNLHGYFFHLPILTELAKTKKIVWTLHDMWTMTGHCGISVCKNPTNNGFYKCKSQFEYVPILLPRSKALSISKKEILADLPITYITPSVWLKNIFLKSHLRKHAVSVVPNGIDTSIFYNQKTSKQHFAKELGLSLEKPILLFIANNFSDPAKGGDTIKRILSDERLRHVQFIAIGNGKLPKHHNLTLIPYLKNKDQLAKYYTVANAFLHPALVDNFPGAVLESLASGTHVIAYNAGGIPEQVRDTIDGTIVPHGDYEAFMSAIIDSLTNRADSELLVEIANRAGETFSKETMVTKYVNIYKSL